MKVWWCEEHRSTRQECLDHGTWAECRIVEMQLVPADALVIQKANGAWPTLLVMELADLLAYTRYDDDPVQYHEARKFLDDLAAANV